MILPTISVIATGIKKYVGNNPNSRIKKTMASQIIEAKTKIAKTQTFFSRYLFIPTLTNLNIHGAVNLRKCLHMYLFAN